MRVSEAHSRMRELQRLQPPDGWVSAARGPQQLQGCCPRAPRDGPSHPEVHFYGQQQQKPPQILANNEMAGNELSFF